MAVSDREGVMVYKDLGPGVAGARRAAHRVAPRRPGHRPLPLLHDRLDALGEQPADASGWAPGGRSPSATTATSSTPGSCWRSCRAAGRRLVGTTDTEVLTALLADEPGADLVEALVSAPAAGRGRLLAGGHGRGPGHRVRATRTASGRSCWAGCRWTRWWRDAPPLTGHDEAASAAAALADGHDPSSPVAAAARLGAGIRDRRARRPGRGLRARRGAGRDGRPGRAGRAALHPVRARARSGCACSSSSTSRGPDSYMLGRNLYEVRRRMGEVLAREAPADADLVMPVPDTGAPAAAGYAEASGHPVSGGHGQEPVRRSDVHPAQPVDAPAGREHEARACSGSRSAASGSWSWTTPSCAARPPARSCAAAPRGRRGGPPAHQRAAHLPSLLLRHRHVHRDRAHRVAHGRRGHPGLRGRRLARLPVHRRGARRHRPAPLPLLLRLLRRRLPGAGALRRGLPQVRARARRAALGRATAT